MLPRTGIPALWEDGEETAEETLLRRLYFFCLMMMMRWKSCPQTQKTILGVPNPVVCPPIYDIENHLSKMFLAWNFYQRLSNDDRMLQSFFLPTMLSR